MSLSRRKLYSFVETLSSHPPAPSPTSWSSAGNHIAGPRPHVVQIELPGSVFLLGPARDQRSPIPEFAGPGQDAGFGGTGDDDLEPDFSTVHCAIAGCSRLATHLLPTFAGAWNPRAPSFLISSHHLSERGLVLAGQDQLVAC